MPVHGGTLKDPDFIQFEKKKIPREKLEKLGNFQDYFATLVNFNFFLFIDESAHLMMFEATLQISKICQNYQFFSETFFYFDFHEICAKIVL